MSKGFFVPNHIFRFIGAQSWSIAHLTPEKTPNCGKMAISIELLGIMLSSTGLLMEFFCGRDIYRGFVEGFFLPESAFTIHRPPKLVNCSLCTEKTPKCEILANSNEFLGKMESTTGLLMEFFCGRDAS